MMNKESKIIVYDVQTQVSVRKYAVNTERLKELLQKYIKETGYTRKQISETLGIPQTKTDHWFRKDSCFAIPDPEYWYQLKELLNIKTNEFDESIMTFETRPGIYEKTNRVYGIYGIAPTLTRTDADIKILLE